MKHLSDKAMHMFDSKKEEVDDSAENVKSDVKDVCMKNGEIFIIFLFYNSDKYHNYA